MSGPSAFGLAAAFRKQRKLGFEIARLVDIGAQKRMPRRDQFLNNGGADRSGGTGKETHEGSFQVYVDCPRTRHSGKVYR